METVHYKVYGDPQLPSLYIAHGVFGMLDNWHFIAQKLSTTFRVVTFDARNHGKSFHDADASYDAMSSDLESLMNHLNDEKAFIIGHSMGGKTVMNFCHSHPERVRKLMVVDIAPKAYKPSHLKFIQAFKEIPFERLQSRKDADLAFSEYAENLAIRQFLLKNIEGRPDGGYQLKINIQALENHYYGIIGNISLERTLETPVCFIKGGTSHYIQEEDKSHILNFFPNAHFKTIDHAGHWVHAEQPQAFIDAVLECFADNHP